MSEQTEYKSSSQVLSIALVAYMGSFFFGYQVSVAALSWKFLTKNPYGIANDPNVATFEGYFTAAMTLGAGFAALSSSSILQFMGRRKVLILTDIIGITGSLLFLVANINVGILGRLICGIAVGLNSAVTPLYIKEISPKQLSGMTGSFNQAFINAGLIVACFFGLFFPISEQEIREAGGIYWRFVYIFPVIPCLIRTLMLSFVFTFDTPHYYIGQGQDELAKNFIEQIYKQDYHDSQFQSIRQEIQGKTATKIGFAQMFNERFRSRMILGMLLQTIQQFSGINAINFYSGKIFEKITGSQQTANLLTLFYQITATIFAFVCGAIIGKFGRKTLLLGGCFMCCLVLLGVGVGSVLQEQNEKQWISIIIMICIFSYVIFFSLSLGPIVWLYNAETLPDAGLAIATFTNWSLSFIIAQTFPKLSQEESLGLKNLFFIFAGFCAFGCLIMMIFVKETRNKTGQEIEELFYDKKALSSYGTKQSNLSENELN